MLRLFAILLVALFMHGSCDQWEAVDHTETDLEASGFIEDEPEEILTYVTVEGHYVTGFENSYLYPCGSGEQWWVFGGQDLSRRYYDIATSMHEHVFVRLYGARSELGRYGHLGGGDRGFRVERIIEIRKQGDRDCR